MLSYMGHKILGMNTIQLYMKVSGLLLSYVTSPPGFINDNIPNVMKIRSKWVRYAHWNSSANYQDSYRTEKSGFTQHVEPALQFYITARIPRILLIDRCLVRGPPATKKTTICPLWTWTLGPVTASGLLCLRSIGASSMRFANETKSTISQVIVTCCFWEFSGLHLRKSNYLGHQYI